MNDVDRQLNEVYRDAVKAKSLGKIEMALQLLKIGAESGHLLSLIELGDMYKEQNDLNKAKECYQEAALINPNYRDLITSLDSKKNIDNSEDKIEKELKARMDTKQKFANIMSSNKFIIFAIIITFSFILKTYIFLSYFDFLSGINSVVSLLLMISIWIIYFDMSRNVENKTKGLKLIVNVYTIIIVLLFITIMSIVLLGFIFNYYKEPLKLVFILFAIVSFIFVVFYTFRGLIIKIIQTINFGFHSTSYYYFSAFLLVTLSIISFLTLYYYEIIRYYFISNYHFYIFFLRDIFIQYIDKSFVLSDITGFNALVDILLAFYVGYILLSARKIVETNKKVIDFLNKD